MSEKYISQFKGEEIDDLLTKIPSMESDIEQLNTKVPSIENDIEELIDDVGDVKAEINAYIDARFGDVEIALDNIISYQDELIGGEFE